MKYKYSRKKIANILRKYLWMTCDITLRKKIIKNLLAQKEDKKECCGGHSNGKSTYVDNMAKIYGVKVKHPTPSPLEIEEIEEYIFETSYDRKILNKLISNQKKLYQFIKEKL